MEFVLSVVKNKLRSDALFTTIGDFFGIWTQDALRANDVQ